MFFAETAKEQPMEQVSAVPEVFLPSRQQGLDDGAGCGDGMTRVLFHRQP